MQDDNNPDFDEESLDFDDDDFGDSEFEDDDFDLGDTEDPFQDGESDNVNEGGKRTFVQKYFNIIVLAVILCGGLLFYISFTGGGTETTPTQPYQTGAPEAETASVGTEEDLDLTDMPPMPTPISGTEQTAEIEETPEPFTATQEEDIALLGEETEPAPGPFLADLPPEPAENTEDNMEDSTALQAEELTPLPEYEDSLSPNAEQMAGAPDRSPVPMPELPQADLLPDENDGFLASDSPVPQNNQSAASLSAANTDQQKNEVQERFETELEENRQSIGELERSLDDLRSDVNKRFDESSGNMDELLESIAALRDTVENLQKRIEENAAPARAQQEPASSPSPQPSSAARPAPEPVADTRPKVDTSASAKPEPAANPNRQSAWTLRSAQPDQALISAPGSKDLVSVKTGGNHPDIGRITFIGLQNGKWVVQGTKGRIVQP